MSKKLFLETTIQADRNFSHKRRRTNIDEAVEGKILISSTYVLGEYISSFVRNAVGLHGLLMQSENTSEALCRFGERFHSTREFDRALKVFNAITDDGNMDKKNALKRLNILIEDIMISRFYRNIQEPLLNNTNCIRAQTRPYKEDTFWRFSNNCTKKKAPQCNIKQFVDSNKITFKKLEEIKCKNLEKCINIIKENNESSFQHGIKCWQIGDAIICHEAPTDSIICTTNTIDYEPICEILVKDFSKLK